MQLCSLFTALYNNFNTKDTFRDIYDLKMQLGITTGIA